MNLVYGWCIERIDPEKREQWDMQLEAPLPGQEKAAPSQAQMEQEAADFMATMAMHQARVTRLPG